MDKKTLNYYEKNAQEIYNRYTSIKGGISNYFSEVFKKPSTILDIGAGSCRDMLRLQKQGHNSYGIEPSENLRALAIKNNPELEKKLKPGKLPLKDNLFNIKFDAVICSAVLMHIPKEELFDSIFSIKKYLKENGLLLLSIPDKRPDINENSRDNKERLFNNLESSYLELLLKRAGFSKQKEWKNPDSMGRDEVTWLTMLFKLENSDKIRSIDKIESVLNKDKKTATYKLALFRALCDISYQNINHVVWFQDDKVGIYIDDIVEKWIIYYWPLIENKELIPQIRGEMEKNSKPIAFRADMQKLIEYYKTNGGLSGFFNDFKSNKLSKDCSLILKNLNKILKKTIIKGPVQYAGGFLNENIFEYDKKHKMVIMHKNLWFEISLMNHWIHDSLIIKWAQLTSDISRQKYKPSEIVDLLLEIPNEKRDVQEVKNIISEQKNIICVWSRKTIKKYDIDHMIPFSLWKNNDLWNLLPARPDINHRKRDKLPTNRLLLKNKEIIINYWELYKKLNPMRFQYEAQRISGNNFRKNNWENALFSTVVEAIEITSVQRGYPRWEP
ncbi:MAG: methyltransferase domain-containing protein [Candidatus Muiribacteriota bacterium]